MALDNLISLSFSQEELTQLDGALTTIENILKDKVISLTEAQRKTYGRLGVNNKPWVTEINGYMELKPEITPKFIDKPEWDIDFKTHNDVDPRLMRLESIASQLSDTMLLIGHDLFSNALSYYRNCKLLAKQNVPGAKEIYESLKRMFPGKPKKTANP